MIIQYSYPLLQHDQTLCFLPDPTQQSPQITQTNTDISLPQPLAVILSTIVLVTAVGLTVYILLTLPRNIGKTGSAVVKKTTDTVIPLVIRDKKITKKQRKIISARLAAGIKLLACIIPIVALYIVPGPAPLPDLVVRTVGLICGAYAAFNFLLQYSIARWLHIPDDLLW